MPIAPTYPGVYIQEVPSGVRTITGVATSVTAFVGRARRGPTDADGPVVINSFADFERVFGGLWNASPMSFADRDFFRNGGGQAIIVRLFRSDDGENEPLPAKARLTVGSQENILNLEAANPGAWGNQLRARVDYLTRPAEAGEDGSLLFNLYVRDGTTGVIEEFRNVSVEAGHARQVDLVLSNSSSLVRMTGELPADRPAESENPQGGADPWGDNNPATNATVSETGQVSDGQVLQTEDFTGPGKESAKQGLYALRHADLFNILCLPPHRSGGDVESSLIASAAKLCEDSRAMLLVDPPAAWNIAADATADVGTNSRNAALFFPRLRMPNPLRDNQLEDFVPCGAVAGVMARTDAQRGVWKSPAGLEATLTGVPQLSVTLTDAENGQLNPLGINCLRTMPGAGRVVWGARTLQGSDRLASEWKYIPVRRMALFLEESLYRGTQWVVFEPNDEPLWAQIRLNIGAFMQDLFQQGAFAGRTPREAYLVKCDRETTTPHDVNLGIVNILVGFAPLKPAEFVIIRIQHIAGSVPA